MSPSAWINLPFPLALLSNHHPSYIDPSGQIYTPLPCLMFLPLSHSPWYLAPFSKETSCLCSLTPNFESSFPYLKSPSYSLMFYNPFVNSLKAWKNRESLSKLNLITNNKKVIVEQVLKDCRNGLNESLQMVLKVLTCTSGLS